MDIRFTNRWGGFDYFDLYCILDGILEQLRKTPEDKRLVDLKYDIFKELEKRRKIGGGI